MRKKFKKLLIKSNRQIAVLLILIITAVALYQVLEEYTNKNNFDNEEKLDFDQVRFSQDNSRLYSEVNINNIVPLQQGNGKLYCVAGNDENLYLIIVNIDQYDYIQREIGNVGSAKVQGITKKYTDGLKAMYVQLYNQMYQDGNLNDNNFESYFGDLVLVQEGPYDGALQIVSLFLLLCYIYIILILVRNVPVVVRLIKIKKQYSKEDFKEINKELEDLFTSCYRKVDLLLTKTYILDFTYGFNIIRYSDVTWVYREKKGLARESIIIYNNEFKKMKIANRYHISFGKREKLERDDIFDLIAERSTNALVGDTQENILEFQKTKEEYKEKIKEEKMKNK